MKAWWRHFTWRRGLVVLLGLTVALVAVLYPGWKEGSDNGGQKPAEPFRIAGNFYYVGANDAAAFLITGPEGHVLIDGGYPGTPPLIMASIAKLGFDIKDVKVLLNSEPHSATPAGWRRSSRRPAPSCGQAKRARTLSPPVATTPTSSCRCGHSSGRGSSATRPRASTTGSRTATRSASAPSPSPRTSRAATRAAAPRGRSRSATVTAS